MASTKTSSLPSTGAAMTSGIELPSLYKPLADTNEIRLIFLQPRSSADRIICQMKQSKLSDNLRYEALSYVWGSKEERARHTGTASINLREFPIGYNLELALLHLRLDDKIRVLWVDAICINQSDVAERDSQVAQMGQIYARARRVVAWLGPSSDISREAIRAIPEIDSDTSELYYLWHIEEKKSYEHEILEPIKAFCSQKYWSRLWIVQELILATDILIQCGTDHLRWSHLCVFFAQLDTFDRNERRLPLRADSRDTIPARIVGEWKDRKMKEMIEDYQFDTTLFALYYRYRKGECEDFRDKIYGVRSLAAKCCSDAVPVNYSLSRYDLCGVLLQHYILTHMDKEAAGSSKGGLDGSDDSPNNVNYVLRRRRQSESEGGRTNTHTSIMYTSQLLHRSMQITSRGRPKSRASVDFDQENSEESEEELPESDAGISVRSSATFLPHSTNVGITDEAGESPTSEARMKAYEDIHILNESDTKEKPKKHRLKRWHSKLLNLPGKVHDRYLTRTASTRTTAGPPHTPTDIKPVWPKEVLLPVPEAPFKVLGDYKGRIKYLFPVNTNDISQDIRNTALPKYLGFLEGVAIEHGTDLVFRIGRGHCRISIPLNFSIPRTSETAEWRYDISDAIWQSAEKALSKIISKDYTIAVGDHNLMYFVPNGTKIGDLVCNFPETNIVVIVRGETGRKTRIIGRAVSVGGSPFIDSSEPDRSASNERGSEAFRSSRARDEAATERDRFGDVKIPILFELDLPTLQLLTHASAVAPLAYEPQIKPKSYQVLRSQPIRWPGTKSRSAKGYTVQGFIVRIKRLTFNKVNLKFPGIRNSFRR
ncbi:ankyrin and HET domain-containing protein [Phlyctema vagabunda]|uniref:Ankyrin and HET domain-containing protein n=1 Tax=Phlyctema vagabunda TaxID=108571 RepID=A0ABR4PR65_9HELO